MRKALIMLALIGFVAGFGAFAAGEARAGALSPIACALEHDPLLTPVAVWKDCQRIALCAGCRPVFRCRSCEYQRVCRRGRCEWRDVCVWGPYVRVLPPGARIIR
jgi:hypothetical protein